MATPVPKDKETNPAPAGAPVWRPHRRTGLRVALIAFIVIILALLGFGVGVYAGNWQGGWADAVLRVLPYPTARIGLHPISFTDFRSDRQTIEHYYAQSAQQGGSSPTSAFLDKAVLAKLIRELWIALLAEQRGVQATSGEIDAEYATIVEQGGGAVAVETMIRQLYDWSPEQFKQNVVAPFVLREKLRAELAKDPSFDADVRQRAEEVLRRAKAGEDFAELAKEFSQDSTAAAGGDLGTFGRGVMVPEFQSAVETLKPGEVSDLVRTQFGYHIVKLEEHLGSGEKEQWRARHILLKTTDFDAWANRELQSEAVSVFLRGYRWDGSCSSVLADDETCPNQST